jgi:hypothetical protein
VTTISKRLRFEVFRRDNHACRYCGAAAPGAKLTIDHVIPAALGGTGEPSNLVTACADCNSGKSSVSPDASVVADASADALKWGRAISEAAEILEHQLRLRDDLRQQFAGAWHSWTYGPDKKHFPLPVSWGESVDALLAAGLPIGILCDCIDITMAQKWVKDEFRYMCGVAWRKVAGLREIAADLVASDGDE